MSPGAWWWSGAGLAGLEAAWVAAARGHAVTVFSASAEPGGAARLEGHLPGRADVAKTAEFQHGKAMEAGADFRFGKPATTAAVLACEPDAVILATGSRMRWPLALADGTDAVDLRQAVAALAESDDPPSPGTAVLLDMDQTPAVYGAVELLAECFARVVLLTPAAGKRPLRQPDVAHGRRAQARSSSASTCAASPSPSHARATESPAATSSPALRRRSRMSRC